MTIAPRNRGEPPAIIEMKSWVVRRHNLAVQAARKSGALIAGATKLNLKDRKRQHSNDLREVWIIKGVLDILDILSDPPELTEQQRKFRQRKPEEQEQSI